MGAYNYGSGLAINETDDNVATTSTSNSSTNGEVSASLGGDTEVLFLKEFFFPGFMLFFRR